MSTFGKKAFTLIELLIVVAIIAILAAIAVPNFLEAQTRAKVTRAKSDMRTMATGLESYYVDNGAYPLCNDRAVATAYSTAAAGNYKVLENLSTPIAYLTNPVFRDAFSVKFRKSAATASALMASAPVAVTGTDVVAQINSYLYQSVNPLQRATKVNDGFWNSTKAEKAFGWILFSVGPDNTYPNLGGVLDSDLTMDGPILMMYDPTNGTVSQGDIYRAGGQFNPTSVYGCGIGLKKAIDATGGR